MINYPLYDAIHEKADFTREQLIMQPPKVLQMPKYIEQGFPTFP